MLYGGSPCVSSSKELKEKHKKELIELPSGFILKGIESGIGTIPAKFDNKQQLWDFNVT